MCTYNVGYFTPEYHPVRCAHACFYSSRSWVVVNTSVRSSRPGEFSATGLGVCACKAGRISIHSLCSLHPACLYTLLPPLLSRTNTYKESLSRSHIRTCAFVYIAHELVHARAFVYANAYTKAVLVYVCCNGSRCDLCVWDPLHYAGRAHNYVPTSTASWFGLVSCSSSPFHIDLYQADCNACCVGRI